MASVKEYVLAYTILKDISTPWEDFEEFKEGLIDKDGKRDKSVKGEISSYKRLIFNFKRLLQKVTSKNNLVQRVATMFLLKEKEVHISGTTLNIINDYLVETYLLQEDYDLDNLEEQYCESLIESIVEKY